MTRTRQAVFVLALATAPVIAAQTPTPPSSAQGAPLVNAPAQPTISRELQLERDNLLLTARINDLEAQLAQLKSQVINDRISKAAPDLIQKLQAAAPEWDVNPQTLEFTKKAPAPVAAPAPRPN